MDNDTTELVIITFSIVYISIMLLFLYRYFRGSDAVEKRLNAVVDSNSTSRNQHSMLGKKDLYKNGMDKLFNINSIVFQYILAKSKNASLHYQLQFEQAGMSSSGAPTIVLLIRIGSFLVGFLLCEILYVFRSVIAPTNLLLHILCYVVIIYLALQGYDLVMKFMIKRRYERIQRMLPFSVDLLSICVKSGYSLDRSFETIAEEVSYYNMDLCVEFMKVSIELAIIPDRREALRNLAKRLDLPLVKILVSGLIQSEEQGASMGQTLTRLSQDFTKQKIAEISEIANKIPVKILLPLGLFGLPGFLLFLAGPMFSNIARSSFMNQ